MSCKTRIAAIIFVMPYEMDYSLIGTTEISFDGDPSKARISAEEISLSLRRGIALFPRAVKPARRS